MQLNITAAAVHFHHSSPPGMPGADAREFAGPIEVPAFIRRFAPPAHGELWPGQGGHYICTLPALMGVPARHVIAATHDLDKAAWGPYDDDATGAASHHDGPANTQALLATKGKHPAAEAAAAHTADGHSDFHLPSRLDLLIAHICAPQLFKKEGWYWSSTQGSRNSAFAHDFEFGGSGWSYKNDELRVRAFRWIPLST